MTETRASGLMNLGQTELEKWVDCLAGGRT